MKRHAIRLAVGVLLIAVCIGAGRADETSAPGAGQNDAAPLAVEQPPAADPSRLAEVGRLVEASLEALRDGRDYQHQTFLKESLEKMSDFPPARWHSGYVWLEGRWVHVDQAPYVTAESPVLKKYAELRERADAKHYPKATTAQAGREYLLNRRSGDRVVNEQQSNYRALVKQSDKGGTVYIPSTVYLRDQVHVTAQIDTYAQERVRLTNTAGYSPGYARAQEALAQWCAQNGLSEEARVHWAHLLNEEPANREAARALGLVEHRGRFFSKEQVARVVQQEKDVARSLEKWQEVLAKIQREASSPDDTRRKSAIKQLKSIEDANAVYALEAIALWRPAENGQRLEFVEAFEQEVVKLIGRFETQPATEALVRFAVLHTSENVRQAAADGLKRRDPHTFVPLLLAGLTSPIQYDAKIVENERGEKQFQAGAVQEHTSHIAGVRDTRQVYNGWHLRFLATAALARMRQLHDFNLQADQLNRRIVAAILRAMKIDAAGPFKDLALSTEYDSPNPQRWWDWWYDYNEQYVSGYKPYRGYDYNWSTTSAYQANYRPTHDRQIVQDWYIPCVSCFVKGTPVLTLSGPKPIEQLKIGDRVLSQHPETGELTYKGILLTTTRPPSEMLTIRAGKTTLTATLGHPFFVVGKGWRMAKQLKEDDWIAAQGTTLRIRHIKKAEPVEAYNLMVADFGTYFVGEDRIYVHDNSPLSPTRLEMPGLLAAR